MRRKKIIKTSHQASKCQSFRHVGKIRLAMKIYCVPRAICGTLHIPGFFFPWDNERVFSTMWTVENSTKFIFQKKCTLFFQLLPLVTTGPSLCSLAIGANYQVCVDQLLVLLRKPGQWAKLLTFHTGHALHRAASRSRHTISSQCTASNTAQLQTFCVWRAFWRTWLSEAHRALSIYPKRYGE